MANIVGKGHNYRDNTSDPTPVLGTGGNAHGTSVGGLIAARDFNGLGGRGVAPRANLVGYNLMEEDEAGTLTFATDANDADAMTRDVVNIHVSNNSRGATDGLGNLAPSSKTWDLAIETGHKTGRGGLGTVYIWAAGNGRAGGADCANCVDNANYDGQGNYHEVFAVAALDDKGKQASYSESGANLLISAPGGEFCDTHTITTTDLMGSRGSNAPKPSLLNPTPASDEDNQNYTRCFNGTSAATPIVSGVVALILQANPKLGWRDVREILARTARKNDPTDADWTTNGAAFHHNHKYGFGAVDAESAILLALGRVNLGPIKTFESALIPVGNIIPDTGVATTNTTNISGTGISKIESIEVVFSAADHPLAGDLEITLINLSTGTRSVLAEGHNCGPGGCGTYDNWIFSTTRHMGEAADGQWQIIIKDVGPGDTGTFQSWAIGFHGT